MGNIEYLHPPRYVAVQISATRWQIAELVGEPGREGHKPPMYKAQPQKLSEGDCNNRLCDLQREARKQEAKNGQQ